MTNADVIKTRDNAQEAGNGELFDIDNDKLAAVIRPVTNVVKNGALLISVDDKGIEFAAYVAGGNAFAVSRLSVGGGCLNTYATATIKISYEKLRVFFASVRAFAQNNARRTVVGLTGARTIFISDESRKVEIIADTNVEYQPPALGKLVAQIPAKVFARCVKRISFAAGNSYSGGRYQQVYFNLNSDSLTAMATNGRIIAESTFPTGAEAPTFAKFAINADVANYLAKTFGKNDTHEIAIREDGPNLALSCNGVTVRCTKWVEMCSFSDKFLSMEPALTAALPGEELAEVVNICSLELGKDEPLAIKIENDGVYFCGATLEQVQDEDANRTIAEQSALLSAANATANDAKGRITGIAVLISRAQAKADKKLKQADEAILKAIAAAFKPALVNRADKFIAEYVDLAGKVLEAKTDLERLKEEISLANAEAKAASEVIATAKANRRKIMQTAACARMALPADVQGLPSGDAVCALLAPATLAGFAKCAGSDQITLGLLTGDKCTYAFLRAPGVNCITTTQRGTAEYITAAFPAEEAKRIA